MLDSKDGQGLPLVVVRWSLVGKPALACFKVCQVMKSVHVEDVERRKKPESRGLADRTELE